MNKFYLTIGGLILVMISSIGSTVFYLHSKQETEVNIKLLESLGKEDSVPNQNEDLSEIQTNISGPNGSTKEPSPTITKTTTTATSPTTNPNSSNVLTLGIVGTHAIKTDCWIVISSKVYNVTSFLDIHPGGVSSITPYCGKDATDAFNSNSVGHNHSTYARSLLPTYFVGNIGVVVSITPTPISTPTLSSTPTPTTTNASVSLTSAVIASHNSQNNCWIIISNFVYDVTSFLSIHPGGVKTIVQYCGADATAAFNTKSAGHNHSSYARSLLPTYFIGKVGSAATITPTPSGSTPTQAPRKYWSDDDDD